MDATPLTVVDDEIHKLNPLYDEETHVLRLHWLLSNWILGWFILFYFTHGSIQGIILPNPKLALYFALGSNAILFLLLLSLHPVSIWIPILVLLFNFLLKIYPLYLLRNSGPIRIQDFHLLAAILIFYNIILFFLGTNAYELYVKTVFQLAKIQM